MREISKTEMKGQDNNAPMGWQTAARVLEADRRARVRKADARQFIRLCSGLLARHIGAGAAAAAVQEAGPMIGLIRTGSEIQDFAEARGHQGASTGCKYKVKHALLYI